MCEDCAKFGQIRAHVDENITSRIIYLHAPKLEAAESTAIESVRFAVMKYGQHVNLQTILFCFASLFF